MRQSRSNKLKFRDWFMLVFGGLVGFLAGAIFVAWFSQAVGPT